MILRRNNPSLRQFPCLESARFIDEPVATAFRAPQLHVKRSVRRFRHTIFIGHLGSMAGFSPAHQSARVPKPHDRHTPKQIYRPAHRRSARG